MRPIEQDTAKYNLAVQTHNRDQYKSDLKLKNSHKSSAAKNKNHSIEQPMGNKGNLFMFKFLFSINCNVPLKVDRL